MSVKFDIRGPEPGDGNFLLATWLRGLYFGNNWIKNNIEPQTYFDYYDEVIKLILLRPTTEIRLSVMADDPDVILGYSVVERDCLHWIFVKESWRKMGIAKSLVPSGIKSVSSVTDLGNKIRPNNWKLNPFLLTEGVKDGGQKVAHKRRGSKAQGLV
jgi:hypothetical protein